MLILEAIYGVSALCLGCLTSYTDTKEGHIYNRTLLLFLIMAAILGIAYYGYFANDLVILFLSNYGILAAISLILFYTHSFAGGDCKLMLVMGALYPANYYLMYGSNDVTIYLALGFAVFYGYLYLLASALYCLIKEKNKLTVSYVKNYIFSFVKSFVSAAVYISFINLLILAFENREIFLNPWIVRVSCLLMTWLIGKYTFLKKWYVVLALFLVDSIMGVLLQTISFSINPENYILVIVLLLCQIMVGNNLYENIPIDKLQKGMILSSVSTMVMQNSRVRGLPDISTEDLRSRLKEEEILAIKRWASSRKIESLSVVKKIPFAIFIFLGFISYFILWSVVK